MRTAWLFAVAVSLMLAACGDDEDTNGSDDAGVPVDAGGDADAAMGADAGMDAGDEPDAGGATDAGMVADGSTDAGTPCPEGDGGCAACTPEVETVPANQVPEIPEGMKEACQEPDGTASTDCPVVECGGYTTWAFSYTDNRSSFGIVTYDADGTIVQQGEHEGARYVWDITLDATEQTATFHGQGDQTVTVDWSLVCCPEEH
ncbi:MAG: hypothetical protein ACODAU_13685 [Myxococcota bacterium]